MAAIESLKVSKLLPFLTEDLYARYTVHELDDLKDPSALSRVQAIVGGGESRMNGELFDLGTAYGHIALGVDDVAATCEKIRAAGGVITREAGPVKGGSTVIAFVQDPDGYKVELIQNGTHR